MVYAPLTPGYDINKLMEDMVQLRKILKDHRRAELIAAKEHDRVRAAAIRGEGHGSQASIIAPGRRSTQGRRQSGTDRLRAESHAVTDAQPRDSDDEDSTGQGAEREDAQTKAKEELAPGLEATMSTKETADGRRWHRHL